MYIVWLLLTHKGQHKS